MRFLAAFLLLPTPACQPNDRGTPGPVVATSGSGAVIATLSRTRPCEVQVEGVRATVAALPIVADVGGARWTSETTAAGTILRKGSELAARVTETDSSLNVFDPAGAAWIRVSGDEAHGAGGQLLRKISREAHGLVVHAGDATVTGTDDPVLGAALTAIEVPADVRALVACNHVLSRAAEMSK